MKNDIFKRDRRSFLKKTTKGTFGLFALSVLPLTISGCSDNDEVDTKTMVNLGPINELQKGQFPKKVDYEDKVKNGIFTQERKGFVYVIKDSKKEELIFMSPVCTHLECTTTIAESDLQKEGILFYCPCHRGAFDEQGINIGGPPERPLDIFESYVIDGDVYIAILNPIKR